jgi:hypothetical protein
MMGKLISLKYQVEILQRERKSQRGKIRAKIEGNPI